MTEKVCGNCAWRDRDLGFLEKDEDGNWISDVSTVSAGPIFVSTGPIFQVECNWDPQELQKHPSSSCRHWAATRGEWETADAGQKELERLRGLCRRAFLMLRAGNVDLEKAELLEEYRKGC